MSKIIIIFKDIFLKTYYLFKSSKINLSSKIYLHKNSKIILGKNVKIKNNVIISVLENGELNIEDGVIINDNTFIYCSNNILIKSNSRISHNVTITDHNYYFDRKGIDFEKILSKPIIIGKNCWIGCGAVILKGVILNDNSIIKALDRVTK